MTIHRPRTGRTRRLAGLAATLAILALSPAAASAATFTVNSTLDGTDLFPGDGSCLTIAVTCTVRAATMEANALAGHDTIDIPAGTYQLTLLGAGHDPADTPVDSSRDLDLTDDTTVQGAGTDATIIQAGPAPASLAGDASIDRVLEAWNFQTRVTVKDLTVRNGHPLDTARAADLDSDRTGVGGGLRAQGAVFELDHVAVRDSVADCSGGGVALQDEPNNNRPPEPDEFYANEIVASTIEGNEAGSAPAITCPSGDGNGDGGGLFIDFLSFAAATDVERSTFSGNTGKHGGAIYADDNLFTDVSTISGNTAHEEGGGFYFVEAAGVNSNGITESTVARNHADLDGGGIYLHTSPQQNPELPFVDRSIVAENTKGSSAPNDCAGNQQTGPPVSSGGENLESGTSCGFTEPGDVQTADADLGPLADNGGPTWTMMPGPAGDAIDESGSFCPGTDQRGEPRPVDGDGNGSVLCDTGAVEVQRDEGPPGDPTCADNVDNDADGNSDQADAGCQSPEGPPGDPSCFDSIDNDGDLTADQADTDCQEPEGPPGDATCSDNVDNDGDGNTDAADADCQYPPEGPPGDASCSNSVDDDNDGQTDQADTDCQAPEGPPGNASCSDGVDNDGDGQTDAADSGCTPAPPGNPTCFGMQATIVGNGVVNGTNGDDVIVTGNGPDTVDGRGGNDRICTHGGDDFVRGGAGDDRISAGNGADNVGGQAGADLLQGGGGNDELMGSTGNDSLQGNDGNDTLQGGDDADRLQGQNGNDRLAGGAGAPDSCDGGAGTDSTLANSGCEVTTGIP